jgi:hypothetical protein
MYQIGRDSNLLNGNGCKATIVNNIKKKSNDHMLLKFSLHNWVVN